MDDDLFQKITVIGIIIMLLLLFLAGKYVLALKSTMQESLKCNEVVDMIYEQCAEEGNITIHTIKGRNTELSYDRGVCVIK